VYFWDTSTFNIDDGFPVDVTSEDAEVSVRGYASVTATLAQVAGTGNEHKKTGTLTAEQTTKLAPGIYDCLLSTETLGSIEGRLEVYAGPPTATSETNAVIRIDANLPDELVLSWLLEDAAFSPTVETAAILPDPVVAGVSECSVDFTTDIEITSAAYKWYYTYGI
tara:strand:+ start:7494 stop:7991 length:498 start_codon:yes stop_codon:yes gene_type:complete